MRRLWLGLGLVVVVGVLVASVVVATSAAGRSPRAVDAGGPGSGIMGGVWASGSGRMGGGAGETTTSDGTINGMLSVNAATGQVWYHSWHGHFIAKDDA